MLLWQGCTKVQDVRVFNCKRCKILVFICRRCDCGNVYCAKGCAEFARREYLRKSGSKYQQTPTGALKHAARQKAYRERQAKKVTHQGPPQSLFCGTDDVLTGHNARETRIVEANNDNDVTATNCSEKSSSQGAIETSIITLRLSPMPARSYETTIYSSESPKVLCQFCGCWCLNKGRKEFIRRRS